MQPIPITTTTIRFNHEDFIISDRSSPDFGKLAINPFSLKGAVNSYISENLSKKLEKSHIPFAILSNKEPEGKNRQSYPLLQYGMADYQLEITGIAAGSKVLRWWVKSVLKNRDFTILGKLIKTADIQEITQKWFYTILPCKRTYKIANWKPFNTATLGREEKLQGILWGNIHRMLDDLKITFPGSPKTEINLINKTHKGRITSYKKEQAVPWIVYDAEFTTNINLPCNIGIGHEPRLGFGKIKAR